MTLCISYLQPGDDVFSGFDFDKGVASEPGLHVGVGGGQVDFAMVSGEVGLAVAGEGPVVLLTAPTVFARVGVTVAPDLGCNRKELQELQEHLK